MKKLLILFTFFGFYLSSSQSLVAQTSKAIGFVDYNFKYQYDSTNKQKIVEDVVRLYYSENLTVFFSLAKANYDSVIKVRLKEQLSKNQTINLALPSPPLAVQDQFFTIFPEKKSLQFTKFLRNNYLIEDIVQPKWILINRKSIILGYSCQEASTTFKGRKYSVWFTPDIPCSSGPWKLKGLPGMILKAIDSTGQISFEAIFKSSPIYSYIIELPPRPVYATLNELKEAKKAYAEFPEAYLTNGIVSGTRKDGGNIIKSQKPTNSIELSEF